MGGDLNGQDSPEPSVWQEQLRIARLGAFWLAGYVAISTATYSLADIFFFEVDSLYFTTAIVVWVLGYILLVALMRDGAHQHETHGGGIAGYLGLSILTGVAIGVGLVFLVVPGLYFAMRWLPAFARLQKTGEGAIEAMRWSWDATQPFQKTLAVAMIGPVMLYALPIGMIYLQESFGEQWGDALYNSSFVLMNLAIAVSVAWQQLLGVAAYRLIAYGSGVTMGQST